MIYMYSFIVLLVSVLIQVEYVKDHMELLAYSQAPRYDI